MSRDAAVPTAKALRPRCRGAAAGGGRSRFRPGTIAGAFGSGSVSDGGAGIKNGAADRTTIVKGSGTMIPGVFDFRAKPFGCGHQLRPSSYVHYQFSVDDTSYTIMSSLQLYYETDG